MYAKTYLLKQHYTHFHTKIKLCCF